MSGEDDPVNLEKWALSSDGADLYLHASGVVLDGKGLLILGASTSGKSTLVLQMMAFGADLVSDDGVWIRTPEAPRLCRPDQSTDLIEARGVGLLRAGAVKPTAPLDIAVDLGRTEPDRLPPRRMVAFGTARKPLILGANHPALAPALLQMIRFGRSAP